MLTRRTLAACLFTFFVTLSACNQAPVVESETPETVDVTVVATIVAAPVVAVAETAPTPTTEATVSVAPTAEPAGSPSPPAGPGAIEPGPTLPAATAEPQVDDLVTVSDESGTAPATISTGNILATSNRHPQIQLDFSEPMATGTVRAALTITPELPFILTWTDDQSVLLQIDVALEPGGRYVIQIGPAARTRVGLPLTYQRQIVVQMAPLVRQFNVPAASGLGQISIGFNYPVDGESAAAGFKLVPDIPATTSWDETSHTLTIQPRKRLQAETEYVLLFPAGVQDVAGDSMVMPRRLDFATGKAHDYRTYAYETHSAHEPLSITFNRPVDRLSVESAFSLQPAVPGALTWSGNTLIFTPAAGHWEQFRTFQVQIKTTALDEEGQPLLASPLGIYLYTTRYVDVADFGDGLPIQAVLTAGRRSVHYRGFNIPDQTAHLALYAVPPETLVSRLLSQAESVAGLTLVQSWDQPLREGGNDNLDAQELIIPAEVPAGVYLLTLAGAYHNDAIFVLLSDQLLTLKQSPEELLALPATLAEEPAGAYIYSAFNGSGELIAQEVAATADPVHFPDPGGDIAYVLLQADDQFALTGTAGDWQRFGRSVPMPAHLIHVATERPIYQPGQTVFFKGIIRQDNDALVENVAAGVPVTAVLYDSRNNELSRQELMTNDFGTVNGDFQLADGAALGEYQLRLSAYDVTERLIIQVEQYRKPDFAVDLTLSTDRAAVNDKVSVTVDSSYFFGGPVSGAGVTVNVWKVADYDYWSNKRVLRSGQTDEAGLFTAEFSGSETGKYIVEAVVANGSSYTVASSAAIELFPAAHQISVQRGSYLQQPNTPFTVQATLLDLTGAPAANRPVEFVFYRYSRYHHRYSLEAERLTVQSDSQGVASLTLSLPEADWYRVLARSADPAGRLVSGERWFLVWSRSWQGYLAQDESLRISPDRDSYLPGDTATFIIESEYSGPALLTLERGAVYDVLPVALTAPITFVELPIQAHYAPNVHATIQHWDPLNNELTQRTYRSVPDLMLRVATTEVTVPATDRLLNVEIIQDRESYKPGEIANVTLRVTNWQGVPVSAEIELAVVDEAIFALAADNVTPLYDAFYFNRPDQVRTLDNMMPQRSLWIPFGGGMGGGGGDYFEGPRRDFRDTAAYFPALLTDANGEVQVSIPLPDNLTTWRLTARAVTGDTQIGTMQENLLVTQDLLLQPLLPAQLVEGDTIQLSALLHNRTGTTLTLAATLALADETALALPGSAVVEVVLPAGGQQLIGWPIEALTAGESLVTITLTNAEGQIVDQVELPLPVVRRAVHSVTSEAGQLGRELATTVTIPDSELREAYVEVTLNRTIASSLLDGLEDLTGYPYGCVEQTMSRALPNAVVSRALTQLNVFDPVRFAGLTPYIEASVQRLYGFQHYDGGWGWWFSDPTHDYQTAWVVFGLAQTAEAGYPVSETVLANGSDWLARHLAEMDERTRAFALYAMALTGRYELAETRILAATPDHLDSFSVAALALTLHEAGFTDEAQPLVDFLLASRPSGQSYWSGDIEDGYYTRKTMASDVRNTAMVLTALARIRPAAAQIDEIADWLMAQRQAFGWGTTNETSFAIIALTDYLVSRSEFAEVAAYEVWWGDERVASGTIGPETPQASVAIPLAELTPGDFPLRVTQTGLGTLYYRVDTHLYEQASPGEAAGPVAVTRSYRLSAAGEPALSFQPGDLVRVELKVIVSEAAAYVLVEDKVPAGFEPINPGLDTSSGEAQQHYGSGYNYLEMRDGRVSFFITELAPGTYTFVYFARVVQSGTFAALPAEMYAMYDLTVWGRSAGAMVEIPPGG